MVSAHVDELSPTQVFKATEFNSIANGWPRSVVTWTGSALYRATKLCISTPWRVAGKLGSWSRGRARPSTRLQSDEALLLCEWIAGLACGPLDGLGPSRRFEAMEPGAQASGWRALSPVAWTHLALHKGLRVRRSTLLRAGGGRDP